MRKAPLYDENSFLSCAVSSLHAYTQREKNKDAKIRFRKAATKTNTTTTNEEKKREKIMQRVNIQRKRTETSIAIN